MHLPATLIIDLQYIYPQNLIPNIMRKAIIGYISMSNDPLIGGLFGTFGEEASYHLGWFKTFIWLEAYVPLHLPHVPQDHANFELFV